MNGKRSLSRRTVSVALLSFSSGLPLGLVWIAIPDWLRSIGVDIRIVGLITLAQAPWSFKPLWSPLMDRFVPPWLGRRRGWMALAQIALFAMTLALGGIGGHPDSPWVVGALALAIALASATQDIAIDAYAVDVLRPEEQGVAVGARTAVYRAAMYVAGGLSITLAGAFSWPLVIVLLASLYLPMLVVTRLSPEPEERIPPPATLREAIWLPFLGFLSRHRALEILAFVVLYKLADNLATSLVRPFLIDMGYGEFDRGVALATVGIATTLLGTFLGGMLTSVLGLGHALWLFGGFQIFSNLGYVLISTTGVNRPLMYAATGFDNLAMGLGTGAFSVLLLRLTQRRFSATQYALFSSLFGLPRILAGPVTGFVVHALGWTTFFWMTILAGIPGMLFLARFVPIGTKEPELAFDTSSPPTFAAGRGLFARGVVGGGMGALVAFLAMTALAMMQSARANPGSGLDLFSAAAAVVSPDSVGDWIRMGGIATFALFCGLFAAAVAVARRGGNLR